MEKMSLKDVDESFDLLLSAADKASNGDQDLKFLFLTARVIEDFVNCQYHKAMKTALLVVRQEEEALQNQIDNDGSKFVHHCFKIPKKPRSLKRQFFTQSTKEEDDDDDDYKEEKKRRRTYNLEKKKEKYDDQVCLKNPVPSDLPVELKNEIERMKGTDVVMVMQKKLTATDMDTSENRLSVPRRKIRNEFLREEERKILDSKGGIRVCVIEPCLQLRTNLQLKKWKMGNSFLYVLIGNWSSISHNISNHLQPNSEVQLWSFRVGSDLCFALVKL